VFYPHEKCSLEGAHPGGTVHQVLQMFRLPAIQPIIVDFDQSLQVAGYNHKLTVELIHPGKYLLVVSTRIHHETDAPVGKNPARGADRPLDLSILADKIRRFV